MKVGGICGECQKYYRGDGCPSCLSVSSGKTVNFIADFHDAYYDHGLGDVVKSRQHRKALMKEKNLIEVGNERGILDANRQKEVQVAKEYKMLNDQALREMARWN